MYVMFHKYLSLYIYSGYLTRGRKPEYIYSDRYILFFIKMLIKGKFSRGRGFSSGAFIIKKWGLVMFWGTVLMMFYGMNVYIYARR
jgi:hypothetical protein